MPTYEYECKKCGHRFEKFQKMSDEHFKTCPECRGKVRRLPGAGCGVIVKSSGSYSACSESCREYCGRDTPCGG